MANTMVSHWCRVAFELCKGSVVRLDSASRFLGNGFVVFADSNCNTSLILTCEHVLPKNNNDNVVVGSTVKAMLRTGVRFDARVAYVDADRDLALLRADSMPCTALTFWENGAVVSGIDVVLLSFFTMKYGQVLAEPGTFPGKILSEPVWREATRSEEIISDYTSNPGTSGAPVLLQRVNEVVAVNSGAIARSIKTSISVETVKATLREWLQTGDESITIQEMLARIAEQ